MVVHFSSPQSYAKKALWVLKKSLRHCFLYFSVTNSPLGCLHLQSSVNFLNSLDQVVGKDVDNSSISNKVDSNYSNKSFKELLENAVDANGYVNLSNIDFGDSVLMFSGIKASKIFNKSQQANRIYNSYQEAEAIYNHSQEADNIYNYCQEAEEIDNDYQEANKILNKNKTDK